jgi:hypothetical protein
MAKQYSVYISDTDLGNAINEAVKSKTGWSYGDLFREAVIDYLRRDKIREELVELEKRQAASFSAMIKETRRVRGDLQIMLAFLDLFSKVYLLHTPKVPAEAQKESAINAKERYEKLIKQLPEVLQSAHGLVSVSLDLEQGFES